MTYTRAPIGLRAGSKRLVIECVNRVAGPCLESNMEFRYWRRSRNYSELPCCASEADSLSVFDKESRFKRGEDPLIETATSSEVEHRQIEVVDHVEAAWDLAMRLSDAGLRRRETKLIYPHHRLP